MIIGIGKMVKRIPGLPNVIGMDMYEAKALLESLGWTFYTGYPAYPDGLWIGSGSNPGPSTGLHTVADVYTWTPQYSPIAPGTVNEGQEIFFYSWWE